MVRVWISEIEFNDGTKVLFDKKDIVVLVGPNNAGKSASLKELERAIPNSTNLRKIIRNFKLEREGSIEELIDLIKLYSKNQDNNYHGYKFSIYLPNLHHTWPSNANQLGDLAHLFVNILNTQDRLRASDPAENINLISRYGTHPIHFLQRDDSIEKSFCEYFRQAFGKDLIVHRNAGDKVPLYVGEKPELRPGEDRVSIRYLQELEKLDQLSSQGDGMRSFVGVLLNAFISYYSILLIDEPEAFLHPPQARLLGKMLAKNLPSEKQLFLATHSEDFLKGLLDADAPNLKIIRLQRDGVINKVSVLNNKDIKGIWGDSLLRHSNILNGLFHSKVVVCESDSDCRFYSAILDSIYDDCASISPDILFTHCGGKHRIPIVVKALKKLNVPIKVISDFDILNDINPLKEIYEDLGGNWGDIDTDWRLVKTAIDAKRPELETVQLKEEIDSVFKTTSERIIPKEKISEIQRKLKKHPLGLRQKK